MLNPITFALRALALGEWGSKLPFHHKARAHADPPASTQANRATPDTAYAPLDAYLERQLTALKIPGAAMAIVEGAEIVHVRSFGRAGPDTAAPTPQTPFFIGSLSKSVTAVAVMQLVDAGKVELDAPVQRYLPWFRVADPLATAQLTVRHLLNQTSGFSQTVGMIPLADVDDQARATEQQARALATFQPARLPGIAWEYSNVNYNLLGLIIASVSGKSYADYVHQHLFTPLDMRHSYTAKAAAQHDGLAVGHRAWFGWPVATPDLPVPAGSLPSGQLIASVEDMGQYLIAQLNNGQYRESQILSPASMAELQRPAVRATSMSVEMGAYGMGWFVGATAQGPRLWHNGQVPDYFAYMVLLPEQQRGLVLLVNSNQMLLNVALLGVGEGAAALLAGAKPDAFPLGVVPWLLRSFLLIPLLLMLDLLATWRRSQGWHAAYRRRSGGWDWRILPPLLFELALVLLALILLRSNLRRFIILFMPDLAWLVLLCGGFSLIRVSLRLTLMCVGHSARMPHAIVGEEQGL
ncbi:MAG: class A beta-lactamase-related serine hydrolase [Chloroflexia bacterium]|nr:class A beta-lactamase-related serine hydrolase [Chloroflexia bacterium]